MNNHRIATPRKSPDSSNYGQLMYKPPSPSSREAARKRATKKARALAKAEANERKLQQLKQSEEVKGGEAGAKRQGTPKVGRT